MPVLGSDRIITEDGLVGEGDRLLAGVGGDELLEERAVDCRTISGQVAGLGIAPQTAAPQCRDLDAERRPGPAYRPVGNTIPVHGKRPRFGVAAILEEHAAGPA